MTQIIQPDTPIFGPLFYGSKDKRIVEVITSISQSLVAQLLDSPRSTMLTGYRGCGMSTILFLCAVYRVSESRETGSVLFISDNERQQKHMLNTVEMISNGLPGDVDFVKVADNAYKYENHHIHFLTQHDLLSRPFFHWLDVDIKTIVFDFSSQAVDDFKMHDWCMNVVKKDLGNKQMIFGHNIEPGMATTIFHGEMKRSTCDDWNIVQIKES
jgi:hypothetical protein